jgi:MGT family glycosyltransferase
MKDEKTTMAKYIFLPIPEAGNVNPTLAVAQELVTRGHEVIYYLPEPFQEAVQATGAHFRSYETTRRRALSDVSASDRPEAALLLQMMEESRFVLPQVLDRLHAEQADCIAYWSLCWWAKIAVSVLKIPAFLLCPTYAFNEQIMARFSQQHRQQMAGLFTILSKINTELAALCTTYHVPPFDALSAFLHAEPLTIVFIPREFQPAAETFDERYLFVGPSLLPRRQARDFPLDRLSSARPLLYISLGTVWNQRPAFFKQCFEAFGGSRYQVVLSRGEQVDPAMLGPVPENFLVAASVPQLDILSRARSFVTHGGMNSVMESLYYGVPMVVIPHHFEQRLSAQRITDMGLGVTLEEEAVTAAALRDAVERVSNDLACRGRVVHMQHITREAGGYKRTAEAMIRRLDTLASASPSQSIQP